MMALLRVLSLLLFCGIATCQTSTNSKYQWPNARGSSQNNGQTTFSGPNLNNTILTNKFDPGYDAYYFSSTGLLVGPNGMLVTAFYTIYEEVYYQAHVVAITSSGSVQWEYAFTQVFSSLVQPYLSMQNDLICISGRMYPNPGDYSNHTGIACLDFDGQLQWTALPSLDASTAPFTCQNATLVCSQYTCFGLDSTTGTQMWNITTTSYSIYNAVSPDGTAFYTRTANVLYATSCAGAPLWEYTADAGASMTTAAVSVEGNVFFGVQNPDSARNNLCKYVAVNAQGTEVWTSTEVTIYSALTVGSGLVVATAYTGMVAFSEATGEILWQVSLDVNGVSPNNVQASIIDSSGKIYVIKYFDVYSTGEQTYLNIFSHQGVAVYNGSAIGGELSVSAPVINSYGSVYVVTQASLPDIYNSKALYVRRFAAALDCTDGYYDPTQDGKGCTKCAYPYTNYESDQTDCPNVWLRFSPSLGYLIIAVLTFIVLISVLSGERKVAIFLVVLFPSLDFFSDIAYIMSNKFYDLPLFALAVSFVLLNTVMFAVELCRSPRYPSCVLGTPVYALQLLDGAFKVTGLAAGNALTGMLSEFVQRVLPTDISALHGLICHGIVRLVWAVLHVCTLVFLALLYTIIFGAIGMILLFAVLVRLPLVVVWFVLGAILHATKSLCIRRVWYFWVNVWGGGTIAYSEELPEFDTAAYNAGILAEILLEAFPQLIIQGANNTMIGAWSQIALFSTAVSAYMTVDACYRMGYALLVAKKRFVEIPVKPPILSLFVSNSDMVPGKLTAGTVGDASLSIDYKDPTSRLLSSDECE